MKRFLSKDYLHIGKWKYRQKLNMVLLFVGFFPVIILGIFSYIGLRDAVSKKEYDALEASLNQTYASVREQQKIYENLSNYLVYDQGLQDILKKEQTADYDVWQQYVSVVDPLLNIPKYYHEGLDHITIYADSIQVPHDTTLDSYQSMTTKPWFRELHFSEKYMWVYDNESACIVMVRKIPEMNGTTAYLAIFCSKDIIIDQLKNFKREGAGVALYNDDGKVLYHQETPRIKGLKMFPGNKEESYQIASHKVFGMSWYISIFMEKKAVYSTFYPVVWIVLVVVLFCIAAVLVISQFLSSILVRRIENLTTGVNQIEIRNMELNIEDDSEDEIGILVRSFHQLLDQIQQLIREVYEGRIKQQHLEMEALQAQINPHFLYNTLSMINWKALAAGEEDISQTTLALSDFYRTTLNRGKQMIPVEGEIKNVQSYLQIQQMMHDYEFSVVYDIRLEQEGYYMPKLILQPIVENAIEHGLDVRETDKKQLSIRVWERAKTIVFTVIDNGAGMDAQTLQKLEKTHTTGYGVNNVNNRLVLLYGEKSRLRMKSKVGVGTVVRIEIPKQFQSDEIEWKKDKKI